MKILQLCNKPPYPPVDGGTIAMNSITQGLLDEGHEVRVLSVESDKHPVLHDRMPGEYLNATDFSSVYIDLGIHPLDAFIALLCGESYHVKRYVSRTFQERLIEILDHEEFDVVHVESIFLTPYLPTIRRHSKAVVVLRAHNVEHLIWRRTARGTSNPFKSWYLRRLSQALAVYEREHIGDYDGIACITPNDVKFFKEEFRCRKPIIDLPFGIISPDSVENIEAEENSLFHIGSMDWMPNQEGIGWFLKKVWPEVHKRVPEARMYLAGRNMPSNLMNSEIEGVKVIGEVPDSSYFIASKEINVVPLLSGSGIRVKIIEAMSMGKTVVTTTIGAEGIRCTPGKDIIIANTPEEFAKEIRRLVDDKDYCHEIGQNAALLIAEQYNNSKLSKELVAFYEQLLGKKGLMEDEE